MSDEATRIEGRQTTPPTLAAFKPNGRKRASTACRTARAVTCATLTIRTVRTGQYEPPPPRGAHPRQDQAERGVSDEDHIEMRRRFAEEELLQEGGFEPAPDDGAELWVRREEGLLRLYMRQQALEEARKGSA